MDISCRSCKNKTNFVAYLFVVVVVVFIIIFFFNRFFTIS